VRIETLDGRSLEREQSDFEGSPSRRMTWDRVVEKLHWLAEPFADHSLQADIIGAVEALDEIAISELTGLLGKVDPTAQRRRSRGRL
jgi:2-methylcitrate dehydratase